jgi:precorrin-2 dehydrogenase/sirohydrochlorin ferrochelatase
MKYYPIFLRVARRPCLIIGGGSVAERKARSLLEAGAHVTIISPEITPSIAALAAAGAVSHHSRQYTSGDLRGFFLAYAATGDDGLHAQIARDAEEAGVLLNVVDQPDLCSFVVPAVLERGDLVIATSTGGSSPALAKRIRQDLEAALGPEYDLAVQLLGRLRAQLRGRSLTPAERRRIFAALLDSPLLDYLRERQGGEVNRLLATLVGGDVSLASLGMELS